MSILRNSIFYLMGLLLVACQEAPDIRSGQSDSAAHKSHLEQDIPDPVSLKKSPREIALYLCGYSRGIFPNWPEYPAFQEYLSPEEARAVSYMNGRFDQEMSRRGRIKQRAVARFIVRHTVCVSLENEIHTDDTGAVVFGFEQSLPRIPNIPDPDIDNIGDDNAVSMYLSEFERAYQGETTVNNVTIVLEKYDDTYRMRSDVAHSFALPLMERTFWEYLDKDNYGSAEEALAILCDYDVIKCNQIFPYLNAAIQYRVYLSDLFHQQVNFGEIRFKSVSQSGNKSYTAAQITLFHHGERPFSHIYFQTNTNPVQRCKLQLTDNRYDDSFVDINPGESVQAWCILRKDITPMTRMDYLISR